MPFIQILKVAYAEADGLKIDGKRILVDVERGRTVKNWRPRRLAGGLGRTRVAGPNENQRHSGRDSRGNESFSNASTSSKRHRSPSPRRSSSRYD